MICKKSGNKNKLFIVLKIIGIGVLFCALTVFLMSCGSSAERSEDSDKTESYETKDDTSPTALYSAHISEIVAGMKYPYTTIGINETQQTYVYDSDEDGTPDVIAYSYLDVNEDFTDSRPISGFCTIDNGKLVSKAIDGSVGGMALTYSTNLYVTPDKTVYLWQSKDAGITDQYTLSIIEYKLGKGEYAEKILFRDNVTYEECESHYDNIGKYIPKEAEYMSSYRGSAHTKATWCTTMTDAAGFLSMFDISVLPKGSFGKDWKKAYEDYFNRLNDSFDDTMSIQMASEDVNEDGIPEIFLITDSMSGTVNSRTAQCYTFANGRVVQFPIKPREEVELFGGGRDIRIDKKTGQIYYDGITGSYGNDQLQFITHVGQNGFVIEEAFKSGWVTVGAAEIQTSHNFVTLDSDESMDSIFSQETFEAKDPLSWQNVTREDILDFIKRS